MKQRERQRVIAKGRQLVREGSIVHGLQKLYDADARPELRQEIEGMQQETRQLIENQSTRVMKEIYVLLKDHRRLHDLATRFLYSHQFGKATSIQLAMQDGHENHHDFFEKLMEFEAFPEALRVFRRMASQDQVQRRDHECRTLYDGYYTCIHGRLMTSFERLSPEADVLHEEIRCLLDMLEHVGHTALLEDFRSQSVAAGRDEWRHAAEVRLLSATRRLIDRDPENITKTIALVRAAMQRGEWAEVCGALGSLLHLYGLPEHIQLLVHDAMQKLIHEKGR